MPRWWPASARTRYNRALRIDKLTLAALEGTLRLYRDPRRAIEEIPTLRMLTASPQRLEARARDLAARLERLAAPALEIVRVAGASKAGGGALPLVDLPSCCVGIRVAGLSADGVERAMRAADPPVIGRIENEVFLMDVRTLADDELETVAAAVATLTERARP